MFAKSLKKKFISNFPSVRQVYDYDCGARCLQTVFAYYGIDVRGDKMMKLLGTSKSGTSFSKMEKVAKQYGIRVELRKMTILKIKKFIAKKIPVILLLQAYVGKKKVNWDKSWKYGHYVMAIGYDSKKIFFEDPESIFTTYLSFSELEKRWHDISGGKKYVYYGMALYGKPLASHKNKIIKLP